MRSSFDVLEGAFMDKLGEWHPSTQLFAPVFGHVHEDQTKRDSAFTDSNLTGTLLQRRAQTCDILSGIAVLWYVAESLAL